MISEKMKSLICEVLCTCDGINYDELINSEDIDEEIESFYLDEYSDNEEFIRNNLLEQFIKLANEGDIEADKQVGRYYSSLEFDSIEKFHEDLKEAFKYYKMAADQGDIEAAQRAAFEAEETSDKIKYFTIAADNGLQFSQHCLADIYYEGNTTIYDIEPNYELAVKYYKMSIENEKPFPDDYARLARCYLDGLGVEKNNITALMLLNQIKGDSQEGEYIKAILAYEGEIVEPNAEFAFETFNTLACQASYTPAYYYLAECYYKGIGTDIDNKKAMKYYKAGAHQGDEKCKAFLETIK